MKVRDAIKMVEQDGWRQVRTTAAPATSAILRSRERVTIAGHPSDDLASGTRMSILKQAGLDRRQG